MEQLGGNQGSLRNAIFSASGLSCGSGCPRLIPLLPEGRRSRPAAGWLTTNLYDAVNALLWHSRKDCVSRCEWLAGKTPDVIVGLLQSQYTVMDEVACVK